MTALVVTAIDAVTKAWARRALVLHAQHLVGPLWLRLQYNAGISFSISANGPAVSSIVATVVAVVIVLIGVQAAPGVPAAGFGLLLGGGIANVIDRLAARPHEVTDFISVGSFPVFNLADVGVTVGFLFLVVAALRGERLLER